MKMHIGFGPKPSKRAVMLSNMGINLAEGLDFQPHLIVPTAEGGIGLAYRRGCMYGDIEFFNDGEVVALTSNGSGLPYSWMVEPTRDGIAGALNILREFIIMRDEA